jgi:hypothetical protein
MNDARHEMAGVIAAGWAILGWSAVLLFVIIRLGAIALQGLATKWTAWHWLLFVANALFMAYAEGYRGFELKFSPRAAARVLWLRRHADWRLAALAPLFLIGYFAAAPRIVRLTWLGTAVIIGLVVVFQQLPQPWRGILDAGVVIGLSWGLVSFWRLTWQALRSGRYPVAPETPGAAA